MTIENVNTVDAIGVDKEKKKLVMHILDHLEWNDDDHLYLLQEKINTYLNAILDGEIKKKYPHCEGFTIEIKIIAKYEMNEEAKDFFIKAESFLSDYNIPLEFEILEDE